MQSYIFDIGYFNSTTRHLSHVERSLYRDLMDMYYNEEKPIEADLNRLARKLLCKTDQEYNALKSVLAEFFVLDKTSCPNKELYRHPFIDKALKKYPPKPRW